jgi:hypothetical protein
VASTGDDPSADVRASTRFLLLCLVALGGCSADGRNVSIVGDSITVLSQEELARELVSADLEIDAVLGLTVASGAPAIQQAAERRDTTVIVALGTNNLVDGWDQRDADEVAFVIGLLDAEHTLWVIPSNDDGHLLQAVQGAGIRAIRWDQHVRPEWLEPDGVHPNRAGQAAFAELVASATDG